MTGRTDIRVEHEVELLWHRQVVARLRSLDVKLLNQGLQPCAVVVVDLSEHVLDICNHSIVQLDCCRLDLLLLGLRLLFGIHGYRSHTARLLVSLEACLEDSFDEVIRAEDVSGLLVVAHPVCELVDVPGGFEDVVQGHDGRVDLEHLVLDDEVAPPQVEDVGLESRACVYTA